MCYLSEVVKEKSNGEKLVIKEISYEQAKEMTINNHYSKTWNTSFGKLNFGIFKDGVLLGCAVYGNLMNPKSATKITPSGKVIELNRLWIDDVLGKNTETMFLSATFRLLKANTDYDLVQSFADGRLGVGTIYKASNFSYHGKSTSVFYENIITGKAQHKVPMENTKRPKGFILGNLSLARGEMRSFEVDTYRYLYPLRKKVKILLPQEPYPEYKIGKNDTQEITGKGSLARVYIMLKMLELEKEAKEIETFYFQHYDFWEQELEKQKTNKSLIYFRDNYPQKEKLKESIVGSKRKLRLGNR